MRLMFFSNYYTHHQQAFCHNLDVLTNHQFTFVALEEFSEKRKQMGWSAQTDVPFVKQYDEWIAQGNGEDIRRADGIILGNASREMAENCLKEKKPVFHYAERVFKNGYQPLKWLPRIYTYWKNYGRYKSYYLLAAGAYVAADYAMHGAFIRKSYKWGYFPETKKYEIDALIARKDPKKILWCGRFLDWKHPDDVLAVAGRLKQEGYSFEVDMIGCGDMEDTLKQRICHEGLSDCVHLLGVMDPEHVRTHMESAGIYLFTSDFREGWGAVLNESMNSGCAVVASHAIGSVPFLMQHRKNGLIYQNGTMDDLYSKVKYLLDHPEEQRVLGKNAYHTIADLWNAEVAAERFLKLTEEIRDHGYCDLYEDGPCSRAPIIRNNWFEKGKAL